MSTKDTNSPAPGSKDIVTGETAPPLPHDEYTAEFNRRRAEADAKRSRGNRPPAAAPARTPTPAATATTPPASGDGGESAKK
jgi:hypothetical protein